MPDLVFVDSNIFVYAHDRSHALKHSKAQAVVRKCWDEESGCLSLQVLQEFYVNVTQKVRRPLSPKAGRELIAAYAVWPLAVLAPEHLVRASEIEERYQLHFWDALIVAAATILGASTILSEDLQDGQTIEGIVIRNPLL
jgi:predicted nucleic acid-binding protein